MGVPDRDEVMRIHTLQDLNLERVDAWSSKLPSQAPPSHNILKECNGTSVHKPHPFGEEGDTTSLMAVTADGGVIVHTMGPARNSELLDADDYSKLQDGRKRAAAARTEK